MKLVTVMDNQGGENHGLISEHGLSFYAEFPTLKVLFDFGPGGRIPWPTPGSWTSRCRRSSTPSAAMAIMTMQADTRPLWTRG